MKKSIELLKEENRNIRSELEEFRCAERKSKENDRTETETSVQQTCQQMSFRPTKISKLFEGDDNLVCSFNSVIGFTNLCVLFLLFPKFFIS
jgi:hypothetical protein